LDVRLVVLQVPPSNLHACWITYTESSTSASVLSDQVNYQVSFHSSHETTHRSTASLLLSVTRITELNYGAKAWSDRPHK